MAKGQMRQSKEKKKPKQDKDKKKGTSAYAQTYTHAAEQQSDGQERLDGPDWYRRPVGRRYAHLNSRLPRAAADNRRVHTAGGYRRRCSGLHPLPDRPRAAAPRASPRSQSAPPRPRWQTAGRSPGGGPCGCGWETAPPGALKSMLSSRSRSAYGLRCGLRHGFYSSLEMIKPRLPDQNGWATRHRSCEDLNIGMNCGKTRPPVMQKASGRTPRMLSTHHSEVSGSNSS